MKNRFGEEQIVATLREGQSGAKTVEQVCRAHGIAQPTYYGWRCRYGSMAEPDVKRLRDLEKENARLKRLLAERDLELDVVKEFLPKTWPAAARSSSSRRGGRSRRAVPASWWA